VEVLERDFREVPRQFDKLLSIGTLEHAGRDQLPEVIRAHAEYLKPGGSGVIHFIGHVGRLRDTEFWSTQVHAFSRRLDPEPYRGRGSTGASRCGLEIVDIENLRAATTRSRSTTGRGASTVIGRRVHKLNPGKFDERFRRIWRTYLWSCAEMFRSPMARRTSSRS